MKQSLIILVFGLIFNACEQNACNHSFYLESINTKNESDIKKSKKANHSFIESDCDILNEWLNRKSIGNFIKNHIPLELSNKQLMDKPYINDTFIT